jgi:hypothetical protein
LLASDLLVLESRRMAEALRLLEVIPTFLLASEKSRKIFAALGPREHSFTHLLVEPVTASRKEKERTEDLRD